MQRVIALSNYETKARGDELSKKAQGMKWPKIKIDSPRSEAQTMAELRAENARLRIQITSIASRYNAVVTAYDLLSNAADPEVKAALINDVKAKIESIEVKDA
jgi:hypothetical protein